MSEQQEAYGGKVRDAAHFRRMAAENPGATFGASLATMGIMATRHGAFESDMLGSAEYRNLLRSLQEHYPDGLTAGELTGEMDGWQEER